MIVALSWIIVVVVAVVFVVRIVDNILVGLSKANHYLKLHLEVVKKEYFVGDKMVEYLNDYLNRIHIH